VNRRVSEFASKPPGSSSMGETPKPPAQPVSMGETPKPPSQPVTTGETKPQASREALALTHHHPGRLRVRADVFRSNDDARPALASRVLDALDAEPGITSASHNVRTGSILVEYHPGLAHPEAILSRIAAAASLEMPSDISPRGREPALVAIDAARGINELVQELTGHRTDLRSLVPVGMAALAAYSFAVQKDTRLPRWDNLLYWAYSIFSQLHRDEIEAVGNGDAGGSARPAP